MQAQVCSVRAPHSRAVPEEEVQEGTVSHCGKVSSPQGWIHLRLGWISAHAGSVQRCWEDYCTRAPRCAVLPMRQRQHLLEVAAKQPTTMSLGLPDSVICPACCTPAHKQSPLLGAPGGDLCSAACTGCVLCDCNWTCSLMNGTGSTPKGLPAGFTHVHLHMGVHTARCPCVVSAQLPPVAHSTRARWVSSSAAPLRSGCPQLLVLLQADHLPHDARPQQWQEVASGECCPTSNFDNMAWHGSYPSQPLSSLGGHSQQSGPWKNHFLLQALRGTTPDQCLCRAEACWSRLELPGQPDDMKPNIEWAARQVALRQAGRDPAHGCSLGSAGSLQVRIVKHAFDIVHLLTDSNPIQVLVDAIINRWAPLNFTVPAGTAGLSGQRGMCFIAPAPPSSLGDVMPSAAGLAFTALQALGRGC